MRPSLVYGLLAFWVFALVTPCVVTVMEKTGSSFTFNLNEEEQKETVSVDSDQKQLNRQSHFSPYSYSPESGILDVYYLDLRPNPHLKIVLPPPEVLA